MEMDTSEVLSPVGEIPIRRPSRMLEAAHEGGASLARRAAHGAIRGAVAAMAMTGLREFTRHVGLLEEPPPETILRTVVPRPWRGAQHGPRRAQAEAAHWAYGAAAGALFAALPPLLRRSAWSGPLYGLLVWAGFEGGVAPLLGLPQARRRRPFDRIALATDHLLYGSLLSENATLRSAPRPSSPTQEGAR
jgi:hypothetical protein